MADSSLPDVLERNRREEQQQAVRALLMTPMLASHHAVFTLVRRHQSVLRDWFARETGWHFQLESDFARLHKRPADTSDATRPATAGNLAFTRRRYALLCLLLAELERAEAQITLGRLGDSLVKSVAAESALADAGFRFNLDGREERRDLVAVVRILIGLEILARVTGDEDSFVQRGMEGDVLYDINRRMLAALMVTVRGPSQVEDEESADTTRRIAALNETFVPDSRDAQNLALRQRLTARLLDDPVVYWDDLEEAERTYLAGQRGYITRRIEDATGLVPEIRAEGIAMVDPQRSLTDQNMLAEGTDGHVTLLIAGCLANERNGEPVAISTLADRVDDWREIYRNYWRKSTREPGAANQLAREAVSRLLGMRLVRKGDDDTVVARPALARFTVADPRHTDAHADI